MKRVLTNPNTLVRDVMTTSLVTVSMDDSLRTVQKLFSEHTFHHVMVVEGKKLVGLVSDRDLLLHLSPFVGNNFNERPQDLATLDKRVHQFMSRKIVTVAPTTTLQNAIEKILDHTVSCLPVVDENSHAVGIVTWRDILLHLIGGKTAG